MQLEYLVCNKFYKESYSTTISNDIIQELVGINSCQPPLKTLILQHNQRSIYQIFDFLDAAAEHSPINSGAMEEPMSFICLLITFNTLIYYMFTVLNLTSPAGFFAHINS